jgi:hypothetical protein
VNRNDGFSQKMVLVFDGGFDVECSTDTRQRIKAEFFHGRGSSDALSGTE